MNKDIRGQTTYRSRALERMPKKDGNLNRPRRRIKRDEAIDNDPLGLPVCHGLTALSMAFNLSNGVSGRVSRSNRCRLDPKILDPGESFKPG